MSDDTHRLRPRESSLSDAPTGQMRARTTLAVEAAGRTDKGRVRPGNEDAFGFEPPTSAQARAYGTLLIVSDGMGGHAAGEVASKLAVETIAATYYRERGATTAAAIENAIVAANSAIFNDAEADRTHAGMGCTIVVMVVQGSSLTVGHVGDSRGYLIRSGRAQQLTRDHSWVAMQVAEGILTPEQAEHHPNRSLLMRALGRQPTVEVEIGHHQLQAGDVLLLCSDGLTGVVNDAEIGEYASRYAPATAADQLVNLANQRGAPDNVTVLTAAVTSAAGTPAAGSNAATLIAPTADAATPRMAPASTTDTVPMPRATASPAPPPVGTPVVLARESSPSHAMSAPSGRRGRGKLVAGGLAAAGVAAGLALLTLLGPGLVSDPEPARVADAPAASKPAATPVTGQSGPAATVPPPVATGLPQGAPPAQSVAAAPPAPAAPQPPAAPPAPAAPQPPAATATAQLPAVVATGASAAKPAATAIAAIAGNPAGTPLIPGVASIFSTPTAPASSPQAAAPTSVPTATPTPVPSGAEAPVPEGTESSPEGEMAPDEGAGDGAPDAGEPATDGAEKPSEGTAAEPAPPGPPGQPPSGPRVSPGSGISIPGGLPPLRPGRKPGDD